MKKPIRKFKGLVRSVRLFSLGYTEAENLMENHRARFAWLNGRGTGL